MSKSARDPQFGLLRLDVAESTLDRFLHGAGHAASQLQLAGPGRNRHLDSVQADGAVGRHAGGVDSPWRERISGNQITTALLRHADKPLLASLLYGCS